MKRESSFGVIRQSYEYVEICKSGKREDGVEALQRRLDFLIGISGETGCSCSDSLLSASCKHRLKEDHTMSKREEVPLSHNGKPPLSKGGQSSLSSSSRKRRTTTTSSRGGEVARLSAMESPSHTHRSSHLTSRGSGQGRQAWDTEEHVCQQDEHRRRRSSSSSSTHRAPSLGADAMGSLRGSRLAPPSPVAPLEDNRRRQSAGAAVPPKGRHPGGKASESKTGTKREAGAGPKPPPSTTAVKSVTGDKTNTQETTGTAPPQGESDNMTARKQTYWTVNTGRATHMGHTCREGRRQILRGDAIVVRTGRLSRLFYHIRCYSGNADPRTQRNSSYDQYKDRVGPSPPSAKDGWETRSYGWHGTSSLGVSPSQAPAAASIFELDATRRRQRLYGRRGRCTFETIPEPVILTYEP